MQAAINSTPANRIKLTQVQAVLAELLAETLRRGFYGKVALELVLQDGTIQNIRRVVEKIEK